MSIKNLVWLRNDLRTADNLALHGATQAGGGVVCLYVVSPGDWRRHDDAPCKIEFTLRTLEALSRRLGELNIPLLVRTAASPKDVPGGVMGVAKALRAEAVFWNDEYGVNERRRDEETRRTLVKAGCRVSTLADQVVQRPGTVLTGNQTPYTVFTPFKRAWLGRLGGVEWKPVAVPRKQGETGIKSEAVPRAGEGELKEFVSAVPAELWAAGEGEAKRRLAKFAKTGMSAYAERRDFPAMEGTSALSPYLAVGAISVRECLEAAVEVNGGKAEGGGAGASTWISELIWREFYKHVLVAFPRVSMGRAFKPATEKIRWAENAAHLRAWEEGQTGYPIVDAGMRQLRATGWMHNRVRMVVAMFLTKDMFLDWRLGERHFMRSLIDGELAANNGGWQWSASTGTDAAPYFRIFNPRSQSERFDAEGAYIRRWVPELAKVSVEEVHEPSPLVRASVGYAAPIVEHAKAAARVKAAFGGLG